MFFRTKFIKGSPLVQLVESFRNSEGLPRQRIVVSLGNANLPESETKAIALAVESRLSGVEELLPPALSSEATTWVDRILSLASRQRKPTTTSPSRNEEKINGVLIDSIQNENIVQLGPELVALHAWNQLGLTSALTHLGLNPSQIATSQLLVANRLIEPLSEWALIDWSRRSALPEILNICPTKTAKDRIYHTGDLLFSKRKKIEEHLRNQERDLFSLPRRIVLYDMTNTHFEGLCEGNPKAHHGKNKQGRDDCRQVAVGMAFDENGFALAHEIFEGNIGESKTLVTILQRLSEGNIEGSGKKKSLVILDAGFATKENIALLQAEGHGYIVNATRSRREQYANDFSSDGFTLVPGRKEERPVEVKTIDDPEMPGAKLVLCRSAARAEKELAMLSKAEERFLTEANKLCDRVAKGLLKAPDRIERAIGKLFKTHSRVGRFYSVEREEQGVCIQRKDERFERAQESCGNYVLKTDQTMIEGTQIWELYMTLLQAEEGFQLLKGTLGLRPNYHHLEERVEAHIFITVLAYHLLTWIRKKLADSGDRRDWKGLRQILSTHSVVTTVLPLADGRVLRIRKASKPDQEQEGIYRALEIDWKAKYLTQKTYH